MAYAWAEPLASVMGPYLESVKEARYIRVRDGTRLAAYIFRPRTGSETAGDRLPVVWIHNRYHFRSVSRKQAEHWSDRFPWLRPAENELDDTTIGAQITIEDIPWLRRLLCHGFVIAFVDIRGSGASFGTFVAPFSPQEAQDAYDVTEWFATQEWCNGSVGMFGRSYMGTNQHLAALAGPPSLKAIFPEMAVYDLYSFAYPGGIFRHDFARNWTADLRTCDNTDAAVPVDEDVTGSLLELARNEHRGNRDLYRMFVELPFRDSIDAQTGVPPHLVYSPSFADTQAQTAAVPVYLLAGWFDPFVRDALIWFNNTDVPKKIVIGPWAHEGSLGIDLAVEHLDWYERWLNGAADHSAAEPPIQYYTIGAPQGSRWRSAWEWPIPEAQPTRLFFHQGPSGTVNSVNDGLLAPDQPTSEQGSDSYRVDYSATSGTATRWTNAYGGPFGYPDMAANDQKALTYTTEPLNCPLEATGHPVVHLWITSAAKDGDFFVYLEDVAEDGYSKYVSEGSLRASHRALCSPPFACMGLPYHRSFAADIAELPDRPVELVFDLFPISWVFHAGHRIRLAITCTDRDNALTPQLPVPPQVDIHRSARNASYLVMPIVTS